MPGGSSAAPFAKPRLRRFPLLSSYLCSLSGAPSAGIKREKLVRARFFSLYAGWLNICYSSAAPFAKPRLRRFPLLRSYLCSLSGAPSARIKREKFVRARFFSLYTGWLNCNTVYKFILEKVLSLLTIDRFYIILIA